MADLVESADRSVKSTGDLLHLTDGTDYRFPFWFRGQADSAWPLTPKVWRHGRPDSEEDNAIQEFMGHARARNRDCPPPDHLWDWLFLMQHYGAPTRLLDWSTSPLVAAYFAVTEPSCRDCPGAVFRLSPRAQNLRDTNQDAVYAIRGDRADLGGYGVAAVMADHFDRRQVAQGSAFTLHNPKFSDLLAHPAAASTVVKYVIPPTAKISIAVGLEQLGVTRAVLFPDLQGLGDQVYDLFKRGLLS